ncbi:MAG: tautomerase family protein [bacterium]
MPLIQVKGIEGTLTRVQKERLLESLTNAAVSVVGENLRSVVWVLIDEVASGDWSIGGKPLTTQDVKALAGAKS